MYNKLLSIDSDNLATESGYDSMISFDEDNDNDDDVYNIMMYIIYIMNNLIVIIVFCAVPIYDYSIIYHLSRYFG